MPVYKFKSFEEAEKALWHFKPDKAYYKKISLMLKNGRQLLHFKARPGIQKFRTIEEANKALKKELLNLRAH